MSSKSTPNLPPGVPKGHQRGSAEKHQREARQGPVEPNVGTDSQVLRAGMPDPYVETRLSTRTDLAGIEDRAS